MKKYLDKKRGYMNILVIGGTRFMGRHLIEALLEEKHEVTIATRGISEDPFENRVNRIIIDRSSEESMKKQFIGQSYNVVYDTISYCSNDAKILLDNIECKKYIVISTAAVYNTKGITVEEDFNPLEKELIWCSRTDFPYAEIKRQMECALFQEYKQFSPIAVRFPFVIGEDDYTNRLEFYVEHILKEIPMQSDNMNVPLAFVRSDEAGKFLAHLANSEFIGSVNGASSENISMREVADYVTKVTGKQAILSEDGEIAPYNGDYSYALDTRLANKLGYKFSPTQEWLYELVDYFINKLDASLN